MLLTVAGLCIHKAGAISAVQGYQETPILLQRLLQSLGVLAREPSGKEEERGDRYLFLSPPTVTFPKARVYPTSSSTSKYSSSEITQK
jgi:hypothetical protein